MPRWGALTCAFLAVLTASRGHLMLRLARNLFTPGIPRGVEPRYPLVLDETLARDITVVVGTKDSVTPSQTQLTHLARALPAHVRVIYTYPAPLFEEPDAYAAKLRAAAGPLAKRLKLLPVGTFANPFRAWLEARQLGYSRGRQSWPAPAPREMGGPQSTSDRPCRAPRGTARRRRR